MLTVENKISFSVKDKTKVKFTPVQALRLCTGSTAHRGSRGIALPFMNMALEGVRGKRHAPTALYPPEKTGTHCIGS